MLEVRVHNVVSQVLGGAESQHKVLYDALSYREDGFMFSPAYKSKDWDGYSRLYNPPIEGRDFGKFPTGLLHRAAGALEAANLPFRIADCREEPPPEPPLPVELREDRYYQHDAVAAARARTRGIIRVATAGGKNSIASLLIGQINQPTMFIVHKISLLRQSRATFEAALGVPVGIVQADNRRIERFNVATIQTLDSVLWSATGEELRHFVQSVCRHVIVDEAHHASSPSYQRVLGHFLAAYYRFGLSATPLKHEGVTQSKDMRIEGAFGRVVYAKDRAALTAEGYLAHPHVFFV